MNRWGVLVVLGLMMAPAMAIDGVMVSGLSGSKAVLEIDGKRRVLSVGESSPEGLTLIEVSEDAAVVEFDGKREQIQLGSDISTSFIVPPEEERLSPDSDGQYLASGSINGHPAGFLIDTTTNEMAISSVLASRLGIDYKSGERGVASTASNDVEAYRVVLDSVRIGKITQHNIPAVVLEGSHPGNILLGMDFLSRLDMTREGEVIVLKQK